MNRLIALILISIFISYIAYAESITITIDGKPAETQENAVAKMRGESITIKGNPGGNSDIILSIVGPANVNLMYTPYTAAEYINGINFTISSDEAYSPLGVYKVTVGYNGSDVHAYYKVVNSPTISDASVSLTIEETTVVKGSRLSGITGVVIPVNTASLSYTATNENGVAVDWGKGIVTKIGVDGSFEIPDIEVQDSANTGTYTLTVSGPDGQPTISKTFTVKSAESSKPSGRSGGGGSGGGLVVIPKTETAKIADVSVLGSENNGVTYEVVKVVNVGFGLGAGFSLTATKNGEAVGSDSAIKKIIIHNQTIPSNINTYTLVAYLVYEDGTISLIPKTRIYNSDYCFVTNQLGTVIFKNNKHIFTDSESIPDWSVNYIDALSARGFIVGNEDGEFEAERNITRAEFAAILVRAFAIEGSSDNMNFDDVNTTDWYYNYVSTAYANGVISGYSAEEFKPNQNVTREEMVTMLGRAAEKLNIQLPTKNESTDFADADDFAEYSMQYATMMQKAGIVQGKSINVFSPKLYATRAEVCKVIYGVFNLSF